MKLNSFAFVQNLRVPSEKAHSIYAVQTCCASAKLNYRSNLVIPTRKTNKNLPEDVYSSYAIAREQFTVTFLQTPDFITRQLKFLRPLSPHIFTLTSLYFALKAWFYLRQSQVEIVQTSDPEILVIFKLLASFYHPQIIYDVHIDPPSWVSGSILNFSNHALVNCRYFQKELIRRGVSKSKITILPNGYDPNTLTSKTKSKLRRQLKLPEKRFLIGYTGRFTTLDQEKGIGELINITSLLPQNIPASIILVGGPQDNAREYQKLAHQLKLSSDQIIIIDQLPPHQVAPYIQALDLAWLVYPDTPHFRHKMSPMKAMEYMAAGIPIIASDFPSLQDLLGNDKAFLVDPDNQNSIIKTVTNIYQKPELAQTKAQVAQKFARNFTWTKRQQLIFNKLLQ